MPNRTHPSPALSQLRIQSSRPHAKAEQHGVCALEDYTCLTGESFAIRALRAQLRRAAPHFRFALIIGEIGTSKETVALALHRLTAESDATFIKHTFASLLIALQELTPRPNMLSLPDPIRSDSTRKTMFFPDADSLNHGEQLCLLQTLRRFVSLKCGADRPRIIFAAGPDLRGLSSAGHFDRNLYRMISSVEIMLPPLRCRPEDIPLITCALLSRSASSSAFDGRALSSLQCHDWPGNGRELERVVELARRRAALDLDRKDGVIEPVHLPPLTQLPRLINPRFDTQVERLDDIIQNHVLDVLLRCKGNKLRAAERLGISRSTLYRMLEASAPSSALDRTA